MATKIIPRSDHVLVRILPTAIEDQSGLVLPESAKKAMRKQAQVLAVGPGRFTENGERIPIDLEEGDRVVLTSYHDEFNVDGLTDAVLLCEVDVVAVIREEE